MAIINNFKFFCHFKNYLEDTKYTVNAVLIIFGLCVCYNTLHFRSANLKPNFHIHNRILVIFEQNSQRRFVKMILLLGKVCSRMRWLCTIKSLFPVNYSFKVAKRMQMKLTARLMSQQTILIGAIESQRPVKSGWHLRCTSCITIKRDPSVARHVRRFLRKYVIIHVFIAGDLRQNE